MARSVQLSYPQALQLVCRLVELLPRVSKACSIVGVGSVLSSALWNVTNSDLLEYCSIFCFHFSKSMVRILFFAYSLTKLYLIYFCPLVQPDDIRQPLQK